MQYALYRVISLFLYVIVNISNVRARRTTYHTQVTDCSVSYTKTKLLYVCVSICLNSIFVLRFIMKLKDSTISLKMMPVNSFLFSIEVS